MKKLLAFLAAILLAAGSCAAGEGAATEEKALELAGSLVSYPAVTGLADAELQARINGRINEDLRIDTYLQRMTALISDDDRTIRVTWRGGVTGDVYSAALEAESRTRNMPARTEWASCALDLRDGSAVTLNALFTDPAAARGELETLLEETVELSPHLEHNSLTPLPDGFLLEKTGVTLLYPADQLDTLTGRAGAVKIAWNEIRDITDWSEDGIPARIGAADMVNLTAESAGRIRAAAEAGELPDLPVKIGDSVAEWTERASLLNDPEEYAGGRMFALEGAAFRNVLLLSDALDPGWEQSRVRGIRMERGCLYGLCVGETEISEWRRVLGDPDQTVVFDEETAEAWRTVPGTCDYYTCGERRLQLQADADGRLAAVTLAE